MGVCCCKRIQTPGTFRVRGLYQYKAQNTEDLSFDKGDFMEVDESFRNEMWLHAKHLRTRKQGYIPSNYIVIDDGRPSSHDAWFDVTRVKAERMLLMPGNPSGTYIIRTSSEKKDTVLALSVRCEGNDELKVNHYKIRNLDNGGYCIFANKKFNTIKELTDFYSRNSKLCCKLTEPHARNYKPPITLRDFEIPNGSLQMVKLLKSDTFGEVWEAKYGGTSKYDVAVKTFREGSTDRSRFLEEAKLMYMLQHQRIVQLIGVCSKREPYCIITELLKNGELSEYLKRPHIQQTLTYIDLAEMMFQISEGMAYLEKRNFVHRDLRAANVLVGESGECKVSDFGLTKEEIYRFTPGTRFHIKWTAPEAATEQLFSIKSDVWSFGVVMYEIVTLGSTPYPSMNPREILEQVQKGYRMPKPTNDILGECPDTMYEIMVECWHANPMDRPTFKFLKDFFQTWNVSSETQYKDRDNI